jgi:hypothetical protein
MYIMSGDDNCDTSACKTVPVTFSLKQLYLNMSLPLIEIIFDDISMYLIRSPRVIASDFF